MSSKQQWIDLCETKVDWENTITYTKPRINAERGSKSIGVLFKGGKLMISNSELLSVYSPNVYPPQNTNDQWKLDMNIQLNESPKSKIMQDNIQELQNKLMDDAVKNSIQWFNKKMTREQVEVLCTQMMRFPRDPNTGDSDFTQSPNFRIKIPHYDGKFTCELYNMKGKSILDQNIEPERFPELIPSRSSIRVIAVNGGIWFAAGKFGMTWRLIQACVEARPSLTGRSLLVPTVDSDDEEDMSTQSESSKHNMTTESVTSVNEDEDHDMLARSTTAIYETEAINDTEIVNDSNENKTDSNENKTTSVSESKKGRKVVKK